MLNYNNLWFKSRQTKMYAFFFPSENNWKERIIGEYMFKFRKNSLHFGMSSIIKQGSSMPEGFPELLIKQFSCRPLASFHCDYSTLLSKILL